ncbi:hypothetical protein WIS52_01945 [Pseudonocardia nematodicida]|uniref:Uncharacterized protein n=1 Tax=Pseudonocardia nematodicida TaxID=1206997 RepID=A0ABV1K444_9PSEU
MAHEPYVLPFVDVAQEWVVRCDCGCGLLERYQQKDDADEAAKAAAEVQLP